MVIASGVNGPIGCPVMIIDDHELFSTSLTLALRGRGFDAYEVPVSRLRGVLNRTAGGPAGLVVLDLDLGPDANGRPVNGADLVISLRGLGWKVLIVSAGRDTPGVAAAIAFGAIGSVPKSCSLDRLMQAVTSAAGDKPLMTEAERERWLAQHRHNQERQTAVSRRLPRLSNREREVLELLTEGYRAAAIAERFVVTMSTVRAQIRSILAKLEVNSQLEAVALLRQLPQSPGADRASAHQK